MPFVDKSEIKSGSEIAGTKLWKTSLPKAYTCRYNCLPQVEADQVTRDTRRKKNAWKNVSKTGLPAAGCQKMWKRLRDNLVREKTQEMKT